VKIEKDSKKVKGYETWKGKYYNLKKLIKLFLVKVKKSVSPIRYKNLVLVVLQHNFVTQNYKILLGKDSLLKGTKIMTYIV